MHHPTPRQAVLAIVSDARQALADTFYGAMLEDAEARAFLAPAMVESRLKPALGRWLESLFGADALPREALMAMQRHIGDVHARAGIPIHVVLRSAHLLKRALQDRVLGAGADAEMRIAMLLEVDAGFDAALAEMSASYVAAHGQELRNDEAFRLFTAGHNVDAERQRQLAAVLEWENQLFRSLAAELEPCAVGTLAHSAFGLWLNHKATLLFSEGDDLDALGDAVQHVDRNLLPQLLEPAHPGPGGAQRRMLVRELASELARIRFLLDEMFARLSALDGGRDPLTQVYNRRFLPSILRREVDLYRRKGIAHAVLMIDVDHFKRVNDAHGHEAGDRALQHVAALLFNRVRTCDFVFRYGGEEFLVVLTEIDVPRALDVAESIRARMSASPLGLADGSTLDLTVSIGVAVSDGHPDYERLIQRADRALYAAKDSGRNCCSVAAEAA